MAAFLTGHAVLMLRSIGDNRSTISDAQAAVSYGFKAAFLTGHAVLMLRSIGDNRSTIPDALATASAVLRLLFSPATRS